MENSENKYSNWVFTLFSESISTELMPQQNLKEGLETISDKFIFQKEACPKTNRIHYQGCFVTRIRKRHRTVLYELAVNLGIDIKYITIQRMAGTWEQASEYCSKVDTAVSAPVLSSALQELEANKYKGGDLQIFARDGFYPWQQEVNDIIFEVGSFDIKSSTSREVIWIEDRTGNTGKSIFTKYLAYNNPLITKLPFGSGSQMRASVVEEGAHKVYIIDIPRTLCNDDSANNIYSIIEDIKNGYVKSSMYGKPRTLFMEPPAIIIFSNMPCPIEKLSVDRWKIYAIINDKLISFQHLFSGGGNG